MELQSLLDVPIYGRISVMEAYRPPVRAATPCAARAAVLSCCVQGEAKDLLFILTERYRFCVLEFNAATGACSAWRACARGRGS